MAKTVTDGNGTTHFFDVSLGNGATGQSMVFVPLAVSQAGQVPMLVYYHGHNGQHSIEAYINAMKERDFRPLLKDKKVLLVEPWGGNRSHFGVLQTPAGLATLIDQAMLIATGSGRPAPGSAPSPQSLILAGFSGGGQALNGVVTSSSGSYLNLLSEAWCFDCMYSGEGQKWVNWVGSSPATFKKLRVRLSSGEDSGSPRAQGAIIRAAGGSKIDVGGIVQSSHEGLPGPCIQGFL
jgi:hypothetical protein